MQNARIIAVPTAAYTLLLPERYFTLVVPLRTFSYLHKYRLLET